MKRELDAYSVNKREAATREAGAPLSGPTGTNTYVSPL